MSQKKAKKQASSTGKQVVKQEKKQSPVVQEHLHENREKNHAHKPHSAMHILGTGMAVILGSAFLASNIVTSQLIHPLYNGLVNDDQQSWITFFKLSKNKPEFESYLKEVQGTYRELKPHMDGERVTKQETIRKLEDYLAQNPKARDVLYALSILYRETDDPVKADEYLRQAREIDPSVGR